MNKRIRACTILLTALFFITMNNNLFIKAEGGELVRGDIDGNGVVNVYDILAIRDHIFGTYPLNGNFLAAADLNGDDKIDIFDIMTLRDILFDLPDDPPSKFPSREESHLYFEETEIYLKVGETVKINIHQRTLNMLCTDNHVMTYTVADESIASAQRATSGWTGWDFTVTGNGVGDTTVLASGLQTEWYLPEVDAAPVSFERITIHLSLVVHVVDPSSAPRPPLPSRDEAWLYFEDEEVELSVGETIKIDVLQRAEIRLGDDNHVMSYRGFDENIVSAERAPEDDWDFIVTGKELGTTSIVLYGVYADPQSPYSAVLWHHVTIFRSLIIHVVE